MNTKPIVTVIVAGHKGERWLRVCLESLSAAGSSCELRLVLVDNCDNGDLSFLPGLPFQSSVVRPPRPLGFAEANNFGILSALDQLGAFVVFLNQDTRGEAGWIDRCVETMLKTPAIGAVSPAVVGYENAIPDPGFVAALQRSGITSSGETGGRDVRVLTATALIVRREALLEAGPFDPVYGSYYEDFDLCRRIVLAGYSLRLCPEAVVHHYSGSATSTPEEQQVRQRVMHRNKTIYQARHEGRNRISVLAGYFFVTFPRNLVRGIMRTSSSQSLGVTLGVAIDLLLRMRWLACARVDRRHWVEFLEVIRWPEKSIFENSTHQ